MTVAAKHFAIVRSIYDAALDDRAWRDLPGHLAEYLEGDSAVIWHANGYALPDFAPFNQYTRTLSDYAAHFRFVDPWTQAVAKRNAYSKAFRGSDLMGDQALRQTEYYCDFMRPADIYENIGAHMCIGPGVVSAIGIHRHLTASAFTDRHKHRLQSLIGHLEQMVIIRRQLRSDRSAAELTAIALHGLSVGIVICDAETHVRFANAAAEATASRHAIISLTSAGQCIAAERPEQNARLRQMIANAADGGVGGMLCLADENGDRVLLVVSPLPALIDDGPGRVMITMRSEMDALGPDADMLVALFGLTAAEANLAYSLTQNQPLNAIQARRGVSENTIRTQLAHIFAKTRTANQRELVRLLSMVPTTRGSERCPQSQMQGLKQA